MYNWNLVPSYLAIILILLLLIYSYFDQKIFISDREIRFNQCLAVSLVSMVVNITSIVFIECAAKIPLWINHIIQSLDFLVGGLFSMLIFRYLSYILHENHHDKRILQTWLRWLYLLTFLYSIIIIINPFTGWIYSFTDGTIYVRGPLNKLIFLLYIVQVLMLLQRFFQLRHIADRSLAKTAVVGVFGAFILLVLQLFIPDIMLASIAAAFALLVIFIGTQQSRNGTDALTSVFDWNSLRYSLERSLRNKNPFYLIVIELQDLNVINKQFGQRGGDFFIKTIAQRLWKEIPYGVYRMSSTSFILIIYEKPDHYQKILDHIMQLFEHPWETANMQSKIRASFADLVCPKNCDMDANTLISIIEYASNILKTRTDIGCLHFDQTVRDAYEDNLHLVELIKQNLEKNAFRLCYQPIFSLRSNGYVGAEALLRMNDHDGTPVSPARFIPLAEKVGLIEEIGYLTIKMVCDLLTKNLFPEDWFITINISMQQFVKEDFALRYLQILQDYNITPQRIKLEITEYVLMTNEESATRNMLLLSNHGCGILLDDFGTGYSNLFVVSHLPIECVKFDKSLTDSIIEGDSNYKMMKSFISGIRHTGKQILLEGIEEEKQKEIVLKLGTDMLQGYYFSVPLEEDVFLKNYCNLTQPTA